LTTCASHLVWSRDRFDDLHCVCGAHSPAAPACGLYLAKVHYDGSRKWTPRFPNDLQQQHAGPSGGGDVTDDGGDGESGGGGVGSDGALRADGVGE